MKYIFTVISDSYIRGQPFEITKLKVKCGELYHRYSHRTIDDWNSPHSSVVVQISGNCLKSRLDDPLMKHQLKFNADVLT